MLNLKKKLKNKQFVNMLIIETLVVLGWAWLIASFINVITQNLGSNPVYPAWNFFTLFS